MNIERSGGPDLLPHEESPEYLNRFREAFLHSAETLTEDLRRTLYWTLRLNIECPPYVSFCRAVPGFRYLAIGFLDPEYETDDFGVILFAAFALSDNRERRPDIPSAICIGNRSFPIVTRRIIEFAQGAPPNPLGGTGACFAISKAGSQPIGPGILTAKHVVGDVLGASVALSCGHTGSVGDVGPDGIDAAIVISPCLKNKGHQMQPRQLIAPYTDVDFSGARSTVSTKVTAVTDTKGILNSSALPSRIFLAQPGVGGDSGALVAESRSGTPIGIYMGSYLDPANLTGGIAQHLYQATEIMDMEIFL
jgi:hypothetical protein